MTIQTLTQNWYVSYDVYSDLLQIYDDDVFKLPNDELKEERTNNIRVIFNKESSSPLLFEVKKAYEVLGTNVDSLPKPVIIKLVEPYFSKYA